MVEKERKVFECLRCGWQWFLKKSTNYPVRCPHCDSPYWNKPRNREMAGAK